MNENLKLLEEKVAYLERHVTEQDKVMLELGDEVAALRKEMRALRDREGPGAQRPVEDTGADDRPPHY